MIRPENPYREAPSNISNPRYVHDLGRHNLRRDAFEEAVTATLLSVAEWLFSLELEDVVVKALAQKNGWEHPDDVAEATQEVKWMTEQIAAQLRKEAGEK